VIAHLKLILTELKADRLAGIRPLTLACGQAVNGLVLSGMKRLVLSGIASRAIRNGNQKISRVFGSHLLP